MIYDRDHVLHNATVERRAVRRVTTASLMCKTSWYYSVYYSKLKREREPQQTWASTTLEKIDTMFPFNNNLNFLDPIFEKFSC